MNSDCYLANLPDELLLLIMVNLDCQDIICVRMTCWRYYSLSKDRKLWVTILSRLVIKNHLPPSVAPISYRSADDLEYTVVRYLRSRKKILGTTSENTSLTIKSSTIGPVGWLLVPGGRWLLGPGEDNNLCCWDLAGDSCVEWTEIAQANRRKEEDSHSCYEAKYMYEDGSGATFVAVRRELIPPWIFDFYSVDFTPERPLAKFRGSFESKKLVPMLCVSRSLALCCMRRPVLYTVVILFNWETLLLGGQFECGRLILQPSLQIKYLLPDGRFIATTKGLILLYQSAVMQMVDTLDQPITDVPNITSPLWTYDYQTPNLYIYLAEEGQSDETLQYLGCLHLPTPAPALCRLFICGAGIQIHQIRIPTYKSKWILGSSTLICQHYAWNRATWALQAVGLEPPDHSTRAIDYSSSSLKSGKIILDMIEMGKGADLATSTLEFDEISGQLFCFVRDYADNFRIGVLEFR